MSPAPFRSTAWWLGAGAVLVLVGVLVVVEPMAGLAAAAAVLLVGLTAMYPEALPLASMATLLVIERVGGDAVNLSASDAVLFVAFWVAVVLAPRPFSRPLRTLLWLTVFYQAATLFTVVVNPYVANTVEWFHAWLLTGGALVVGWAVGRSGRASVGLGLVAAGAAGIAVLTVGTAALGFLSTGQLDEVYLEWPWGMHKNFIGCVLAFVATIAFARPSWLGWSRWITSGLFWLCTAGILASQSRQALVGLGVAVLVLTLWREPGRRPRWFVVLAVVPAMALVAGMVRDQLESGNQFNSVYQRLSWYDQALDVWRDSPVVGEGLRWWTAGRTDYEFQPPNAELEVLTSGGVVGLVGFLVLMLGSVIVLWRVDRRFGVLAATLVLNRLVQAQFDLFWVSVQVSVPFVLVGVILGARERERTHVAPDLAAAADLTEARAGRTPRGRAVVRA
ncbi:O-antigen ligase family protein [Isoptericola sp. AK164]|uniref:O-antigen ligase family protein n=1 Tax=Isoptericola sp. AK164 TaxID=3024246 RepID=UPI002418A08D|nr:O-antigen ligase family protein [Isoptericola sp. AK164]